MNLSAQLNKKGFALALLGLNALFASWVQINTTSQDIGTAYFMISILGFLAYLVLPDMPPIFKNWKKDLLVGLVVGFVLASILQGFTFTFLGFPNLVTTAAIFGLSFTAMQIFTTLVFAPITEEVLRHSIYVAVNKVPAISGVGQLRPFLTAAIGAGGFAIFHWSTYGISNQTAFIYAFVVALVNTFVTVKSGSLGRAMIIHAFLNYAALVAAGLI